MHKTKSATSSRQHSEDADVVDVVTGIEPTRVSIEERLTGALVPGQLLGGVILFNGQVTDGERVPVRDGILQPYICLVFGGQGKVSMAQQGIVTNRQDLRRLVFGVECYHASIREADRLADRVIDCLRGFEPVGAGQIDDLNSGRIENPADLKQNHSRDGIGLIFECYANTTTPNE